MTAADNSEAEREASPDGATLIVDGPFRTKHGQQKNRGENHHHARSVLSKFTARPSLVRRRGPTQRGPICRLLLERLPKPHKRPADTMGLHWKAFHWFPFLVSVVALFGFYFSVLWDNVGAREGTRFFCDLARVQATINNATHADAGINTKAGNAVERSVGLSCFLGGGQQIPFSEEQRQRLGFLFGQAHASAQLALATGITTVFLGMLWPMVLYPRQLSLLLASLYACSGLWMACSVFLLFHSKICHGDEYAELLYERPDPDYAEQVGTNVVFHQEASGIQCGVGRDTAPLLFASALMLMCAARVFCTEYFFDPRHTDSCVEGKSELGYSLRSRICNMWLPTLLTCVASYTSFSFLFGSNLVQVNVDHDALLAIDSSFNVSSPIVQSFGLFSFDNGLEGSYPSYSIEQEDVIVDSAFRMARIGRSVVVGLSLASCMYSISTNKYFHLPTYLFAGTLCAACAVGSALVLLLLASDMCGPRYIHLLSMQYKYDFYSESHVGTTAVVYEGVPVSCTPSKGTKTAVACAVLWFLAAIRILASTVLFDRTKDSRDGGSSPPRAGTDYAMVETSTADKAVVIDSVEIGDAGLGDDVTVTTPECSVSSSPAGQEV